MVYDELLLLLIVIAALLSTGALLTLQSDGLYDERDYLNMAFNVAYSTDFSYWVKRNYFYPTVISSTQIFNRFLGFTDPVQIIFSLRLTNLLLTVASISFFIYRIGNSYLDKKVSLVAIVLVLFSTSWISVSRYLMADSIAASISVACVFLLLHNGKHPKWQGILFSGLLFGIGLIIKLSILPMFFSLVLFFYWQSGHRKIEQHIRDFFPFVIGVLAMFLFYGMLDYITVGKPFASFIELVEFDFVHKLNVVFDPPKSAFSFDLYELFLLMSNSYLLVFFSLAGLLYSYFHHKKFFVFSLIFTLPYLMIGFVSEHYSPYRYYFPILPFVCFLASYGVFYVAAALNKGKKELFMIVISIILVVSIFPISTFMGLVEHEDTCIELVQHLRNYAIANNISFNIATLGQCRMPYLLFYNSGINQTMYTSIYSSSFFSSMNEYDYIFLMRGHYLTFRDYLAKNGFYLWKSTENDRFFVLYNNRSAVINYG